MVDDPAGFVFFVFALNRNNQSCLSKLTMTSLCARIKPAGFSGDMPGMICQIVQLVFSFGWL